VGREFDEERETTESRGSGEVKKILVKVVKRKGGRQFQF